MKWLRNVGIFLGAILLAMGLRMLGRPDRRRKAAEKREIGYLESQQKGSADKARKQALKAEMYRDEAKQAAKAHVEVMKNVKTTATKDIISKWTR